MFCPTVGNKSFVGTVKRQRRKQLKKSRIEEVKIILALLGSVTGEMDTHDDVIARFFRLKGFGVIENVSTVPNRTNHIYWTIFV